MRLGARVIAGPFPIHLTMRKGILILTYWVDAERYYKTMYYSSAESWDLHDTQILRRFDRSLMTKVSTPKP